VVIAQTDVRQEDRRADRQEDRRADRQEDRRADRQEDRRADRREVNVEIPRKADGTIDTQALTARIQTLAANGVRDIRIRENGLTRPEEREVAALAQQLAARLGFERVRLREDGDRLRIELRDRNDMARNDERFDRREDRAERQAKVERPERAEKAERPERQEKVERPERQEKVERPERAERAERVERPEHSGRH
jgi:ribonuclease E